MINTKCTKACGTPVALPLAAPSCFDCQSFAAAEATTTTTEVTAKRTTSS
jgi:hypothetical protein